MKRFSWILLLVLPVILRGGTAPTSSFRSQALVGSTLTRVDEQGNVQMFKIEEVQLDPQDPSEEIYLYTVLYQHSHGEWQNLCLPDTKGAAKAIPLTGRWDDTGMHIDDDSITFACTNGALAKCVRWGYKPWKTVRGESLRDYHQACTRMVRADYCGNGNGHTQDGTPIDVYDRLGLQQRSQQSGMAFEAAWGVDGVVQLSRPRFQDAIAQLKKDCPEKIASTKQIITQKTGSKVGDARSLLFNDSYIQSVGYTNPNPL